MSARACPLLLHPPTGELRDQPQPASPARRAHAPGASPARPTPAASARGRPSLDPPNRRRACVRALPRSRLCCIEVPSWGSGSSIPQSVAAPPPRTTTHSRTCTEERLGASMAHLRPRSRLGKRSSQGRSSPVGEGASGGAECKQQPVFDDVASVCFECLRGFE
jgi:hypothetical protein